MSTLDLNFKEYFQIAIKPEGMAKNAFITSNGCFGLSGAPSKFQKTINTNLRLLLGKGVLIYLDNFIVMITAYEEHLRLLRDFFTFLKNAGLRMKSEKCKNTRKKLFGYQNYAKGN